MSSVRTIQHVGCETLGTIADVLRAEDISFEIIRTYAGQPLPKNMDGALGLIIMGGPMGVYEQDRYPFLRDEIRLIESALKEEKPVLGVCLGSQLLVAALGAPVTKGKKKEIGWHRVALTDSGKFDPLWKGVEPSFVAYHWHGEIFELPQAAVSLASSDLTQCQAFRYGNNAYGFLFHMEVTEKIIEQMVATFADELKREGIDGNEIIRKARDYLPSLQKVGQRVFARWANFVKASM